MKIEKIKKKKISPRHKYQENIRGRIYGYNEACDDAYRHYLGEFIKVLKELKEPTNRPITNQHEACINMMNEFYSGKIDQTIQQLQKEME